MAPALFVVGAAPLLRADEQVFEAMIQGWSDQQLSRGLRADTINGRVLMLRGFQRFTAGGPGAGVLSISTSSPPSCAASRSRCRRSGPTKGEPAAVSDFVSDPHYPNEGPSSRMLPGDRRALSSGIACAAE